MANVLLIGRYIPTATSIGEGARTSINMTPNSIPARNSGQTISPATIPWLTNAISPACGAARAVAGSAPGAPANP